MKRLTVTFLVLWSCVACLWSGDYEVMAMAVKDKAICVDGRLDEEAWHQAPVTQPFVQVLGKERTKASLQTCIKVLYGQDSLYIGIRAQVPKGFKPVAQEIPWRGERVEFILKPVVDDPHYYLFTVSAVGKMHEEGCFGHPDYEDGLSFSCAWQQATRVEADCWYAEVRIPYESLEVEEAPVAGTRWKCNFCRGSGNDSDTYSALNPKFNGFHYAGCQLIFK